MFKSGNAATRCTHRTIVSSPNPFILSAIVLAAASSAALAGLGGGGGVHTWTGNIGTGWHTAGNWNTNQVPGAGQSAIVNGGPSNVLLNANSAALRSLFITGSRSVSNNGFLLTVNNTIGTTTVNGIDSTLFLTPNGVSTCFDTNVLTLEQNGRLQMAGGWALVRDQLTLSSGGRVFGNGFIDITSTDPAAFNGANGGDLTVTGGNMRIAVFGGGSVVLPGTVNLNTAGGNLTIAAPFMLPVNNLNLGANDFIADHNWSLAGQLLANPGSGNTSRIGGNGSATIDGDVTVASNGRLLFDTQAAFESTAETSVNANATLELAGPFSSDAGHLTTLGLGGRLLLEGLGPVNGWDGDIISNAGIIESGNPFGVRIDGELTLGSLFAVRSTIAGDSTVRVAGDVNAPGLGAVINSTLDVLGSADVNLGSNAQLIVNGDLILRSGSTSIGDGRIDVSVGGELRVEQGATVAVDVVNAGDVHAGVASNANSINVFGTFAQAPTGRMTFNIGGPAFAQQDYYDITSSATLAGQLNIVLTNGFVPTIGQQFFVLGASSVTGTFDSLAGASGFSVAYTPTSVVLTYQGVGLLGDVNGDGFVDVTDMLLVITAWGACPPAPAACPADLNHDGQVNVADLLVVITNWS